MEFQDLLLIVLGGAIGAILVYFALQYQVQTSREKAHPQLRGEIAANTGEPKGEYPACLQKKV